MNREHDNDVAIAIIPCNCVLKYALIEEI